MCFVLSMISGLMGRDLGILVKMAIFFWLAAIPELIKKVFSGDEIYCCGSSMGGYAAILHGIRLNAAGVYANVAQTWLLGSYYSDSFMSKYFSPIFGENKNCIYNDLKNILNPDIATGCIIAGLRWDKRYYIEQQTLPFIQAMVEHGLNFKVDLRFGTGHQLTHSIPEVAHFS